MNPSESFSGSLLYIAQLNIKEIQFLSSYNLLDGEDNRNLSSDDEWNKGIVKSVQSSLHPRYAFVTKNCILCKVYHSVNLFAARCHCFRG